MKIFDVNNVEMLNPDLSRGYLKEDRIFVTHHKAIEKMEEQWHYEIKREYPNGGKDVKKVIDVPGVEAAEAWDEYEDILRFVEFTEDELAERNSNMEKEKNYLEERFNKIEKCLELLMTAYGVSIDA